MTKEEEIDGWLQALHIAYNQEINYAQNLGTYPATRTGQILSGASTAIRVGLTKCMDQARKMCEISQEEHQSYVILRDTLDALYLHKIHDLKKSFTAKQN